MSKVVEIEKNVKKDIFEVVLQNYGKSDRTKTTCPH